MDWMLSDEEIVIEIKKMGVEVDVDEYDRAIAKAQARKLVEWLDTEMSIANRGFRLARFEECLTTLRKEVGLEEK